MNYDDIIRTWQEKPIKDEADVDLKLHNFRILFAYHSGKIENEHIEYYDTREIFENGKITTYTGNVRTLLEQQNQKDCYNFLKPLILKQQLISLQLIKEIHFEISKGTYNENRFQKDEKPGEFKKYDYVVGYHDVGFDAMSVKNDLNELINEINDYQGNQTLKVAAYLHAKFEQIHPFADGNGRVGRTLMNYYLMIENHPPTVIFEEDRKKYYQALEVFDRDEELNPLVNFLNTQLIKTWSKNK